MPASKYLAVTLSLMLLATQGFAATQETVTGNRLQTRPLLAAHIDSQAGIENIEERREAVTTESAAPLTFSLGSTNVTVSGLIEAEASLVNVEGGDEEDNLRLSTVQIGLDSEFNSWLRGHVIGLWEEDDTEPMVIDEAVLSLTSPWQVVGLTPELHLGRQYLPFGNFASGMISDPLTLELGETHTTAAIVALAGGPWKVTVGGFEGSIDDGNAGLDSWVAAFEATPRNGFTARVSWISDLAESGAELVQDVRVYGNEVSGWSAFVDLRQGDLGMTAEYLAAMNCFKTEQIAAGEDLTGKRPQAFNLELSWQATKKLQLATRYEEAIDYQGDVSRYGATASYGLCNYALLAVEYLHADADGDNPAHTFTAQLAVEF